MTSTAQPDVPGIDRHHLLVVGARDIRRLTDLARDLHTTGAIVDTVAADASDPEGFQAALSSVYAAGSAPGLMVYNAVLAAPDTLLESDISHLQRAYNVDVVSAIVAAQVAAEAMRTAGGGTILFTGGGFADRPVASMATVSLGKGALRSAATMLGDELASRAVRVASITVAGIIAEDTPFSPARIADAYWTIARPDGSWQSEFRFHQQGTSPARNTGCRLG